ncbi:TlpA family protein disulfide reductase [Paenibacillus methanolicus]|uniref:Cytochrome c-type biogenesis protein n=1 Tax=Paenibacillus methanolicus TaxID=582686 RepID=A0A5S5C580_9BACL|nr:TlpA disulfide reductase family protein [Paenibacillus methanolicus]TYP74595.1 cytochrome c-type biogenesis protein [Paenibacillus methanolicus]
MRKWTKWTTALAFTVAFAAIVYVMVANLAGEENEPTAGAATMTLNDFATKLPRTVDFAEKPTVLQVFTSWCPYCNEDAPKLVELQEKYKDQVHVIGINLYHRDTEEDLAAYLTKYGITYPVLLDEDGSIHEKLGKTGFPALFIMDAKGEVASSRVGSIDRSDMEAFIQSAPDFQ